jgi:hypothetical protein
MLFVAKRGNRAWKYSENSGNDKMGLCGQLPVADTKNNEKVNKNG